MTILQTGWLNSKVWGRLIAGCKISIPSLTRMLAEEPVNLLSTVCFLCILSGQPWPPRRMGGWAGETDRQVRARAGQTQDEWRRQGFDHQAQQGERWGQEEPDHQAGEEDGVNSEETAWTGEGGHSGPGGEAFQGNDDADPGEEGAIHHRTWRGRQRSRLARNLARSGFLHFPFSNWVLYFQCRPYFFRIGSVLFKGVP